MGIAKKVKKCGMLGVETGIIMLDLLNHGEYLPNRLIVHGFFLMRALTQLRIYIKDLLPIVAALVDSNPSFVPQEEVFDL